MATQREQDAADYLKRHQIMELMENLTGMLFFYRPGQSSLLEEASSSHIVFLWKLFKIACVSKLLIRLHWLKNPTEFLIEQLEQLQVSRQGGEKGPNLFNSSNLDAVFGMMDPANQKYITFAQYKHALTTMGIKDINECPDGANEDRISLETFKAEA
ncbi:hypothetical protein F2P81_006321 [Scophthalmus maximus]|uniref:EFCAB10 C-terminal EF-hand domain-containing protein n=1 Tax=Scophthalmus maximus TaxID=52904 RepID=A0A6A4T2X2_SCOMX|nr:hypothetical protein F2P81_006321 [Scophthalmus maximus]